MPHPGPRLRHAVIVTLTAGSLVLAGCGSAGTDVGSGDGATSQVAAGGATGASEQPSADSNDPTAPSAGSAESSAGSAESSAGSAKPAASAGGSAAMSGTGGATEVQIEITDAGGCAVDPTTVPAGGVTFTIVNVDATAVNEVHLMSGDRIRGERENLAPGFGATFSATLDGGSYQIYCPGAGTENQPFTVTGQAAETTGDVAELLLQAASDYGDYIGVQAGYLVTATDELDKAVVAGDLAAAQRAYAKARPFYERIEPVAESFGDLDPDIDAREGDVPAARWKGFHQIEKALFAEKSVAKAKPFLADLIANVGTLKKLTDQLSKDTAAKNGKGYQPDEVANGAATLLEEVQTSKITGEEERYSHVDLLDFASNVEGSQQAFAALAPALDKIDPVLSKPISDRFKTLITLLDGHRDDKALGGYTLYTDLSKGEVKKLSDALLAVQEPLSQVSAKVASAG
jgi:iron uptake system component EfeO